VPTPRWTLEELLARVRASLASAYPGVANRQAADLPNIRAIRWYTQLGLVDRPSSVGRTAAYGARHLRQIVAIKRLQAQGFSLVEIQQQLAGIGDDALAAIAQVSDDVLRATTGDEPAGTGLPRPTRRGRLFWSEEAAPPTLDVPVAADPSPPSIVQGVVVGDGVSLVFPCARTLSSDDLAAVRAALAPVHALLRARGLVGEP
jgi:hypothetical protein